jgi:hypothetical protein
MDNSKITLTEPENCYDGIMVVKPEYYLCICPNCGEYSYVPDYIHDIEVRCRHCKTTFRFYTEGEKRISETENIKAAITSDGIAFEF